MKINLLAKLCVNSKSATSTSSRRIPSAAIRWTGRNVNKLGGRAAPPLVGLPSGWPDLLVFVSFCSVRCFISFRLYIQISLDDHATHTLLVLLARGDDEVNGSPDKR